MDKIVHRVKAILVQVLNCEPGDVKLDSKIIPDLGAEGLDLLDIHFRLEREFGIEIPPMELLIHFYFTVKDLVNFLVNIKGVK